MIDYIKLAKDTDEGYKTLLTRCKEVLEIKADVWYSEGEYCEWPSLTDWTEEEIKLNGHMIYINLVFYCPYSNDCTTIKDGIPINYLNKNKEELTVAFYDKLQYTKLSRDMKELNTLRNSAEKMGYKLVEKGNG